jgi:hypothetical protein
MAKPKIQKQQLNETSEDKTMKDTLSLLLGRIIPFKGLVKQRQVSDDEKSKNSKDFDTQNASKLLPKNDSANNI